MSDQKSASRPRQVGKMLANRAGPQQSRGMPMFRYQPVRVVRALLVTLACLVVALASGLPQASADSAQHDQRCHHSSTACRQERIRAEHARKAQQAAAAAAAANRAAKAAAKTVDREPRRTTTHVVTPPPQHSGTATAPPITPTSIPGSTATASTQSPTGHPAAPSAAAPFAAAPLPVAPFTVGSVNPAPPSHSTLPETATRTVSVRSSTPGTRSKSAAFAAPFDAPGSKSLLGIDDSPLLGAVLALLALAVTVMVASAGRRGRRTH